MNRIGAAVVFACLLPAVEAGAQFVAPTISRPAPAVSGKKAAAEKPARTCPEYGAGYTRLDNGTCVKIGGYVRFQAGVSR